MPMCNSHMYYVFHKSTIRIATNSNFFNFKSTEHVAYLLKLFLEPINFFKIGIFIRQSFSKKATLIIKVFTFLRSGTFWIRLQLTMSYINALLVCNEIKTIYLQTIPRHCSKYTLQKVLIGNEFKSTKITNFVLIVIFS